MNRTNKKRWVIGVTGASGMIYAKRFLTRISRMEEIEIDLIVSKNACIVFKEELDVQIDYRESDDVIQKIIGGVSRAKINYHNYEDVSAPPASGSYKRDGMVIVPCSTSTLGAIANGVSTNLIHRAGEVTLKESRPLILVIRESPLSVIHIENMLKLAKAGAKILPASPPFYFKTKSVEELVDSFVSRIISHMNLNDALVKEYS